MVPYPNAFFNHTPLSQGHRRTKSDVVATPAHPVMPAKVPTGISPARRAAMLQQLANAAKSLQNPGSTDDDSPARNSPAPASAPALSVLLRDQSPNASGVALATTSAGPSPSTTFAMLSDMRVFGSLKSSPTSSTSSLLDSGHAFEWPVPRVGSCTALDDIHDAVANASGSDLHLAATDITLEHCMAAENTFINVLMDIGERLRRFPTKDMRRTQLFGELALLNLNLPARVYMPLGVSEDDGKCVV